MGEEGGGGGGGGGRVVVVVREFHPEKDCRRVEEVERRCEVGPSGELSLFTDLLGDPICRVRHSPAFRMLVKFLSFFIPPSSLPFHQVLTLCVCGKVGSDGG